MNTREKRPLLTGLLNEHLSRMQQLQNGLSGKTAEEIEQNPGLLLSSKELSILMLVWGHGVNDVEQ